eukprot:UN12900
MISSGFEGFRFLYIFLTFILLFMWCKKMLLLHGIQSVSPLEDIVTIPEATETSTNSEISQATSVTLAKRKEMQFFMKITVKNVILVLFVSVSACLVAFWWFAYDYILEQNCLTLSIPMNAFSIDCVISSCCVYLLFKFGTNIYDKLCGKCDKCCATLLTSICL